MHIFVGLVFCMMETISILTILALQRQSFLPSLLADLHTIFACHDLYTRFSSI